MASLGSTSSAQDEPDRHARNLAEIERSRALIEEYYELQRQIDVARSRGRVEKQILGGRAELLAIEIKKLTESTEKQKTGITEADKEREKLVERNDYLDAAKAANLAAVEEFEKRVRALLPSLPPPLATKVEDMVRRLPKPDKKREEIEATVASRFAAALGILDQVSRFDSDITVVPEVRELDDGRKVEVQTLYLGLSQAIYAGSGALADVAGIGVPTPDGWRWTERPEAATAIGKAIQQYSREIPAEFVGIPVELRADQESR